MRTSNATSNASTLLICWAHTKYDTRFSASAVNTYVVLTKRRSVASIARDINNDGQLAIDRMLENGEISAAAYNSPDSRVVSGHRVTVKYAKNGRLSVFNA